MKRLLYCLLIAILPAQVYAEGSKELHPKSGQNGPYLQIWDTPNQPTRKFATYAQDTNYRLNVKICGLGEKVYFGLRQNDNDVYFRVRDPQGNTIPIPGLADQDPDPAVYAYRVPSTGNGFINNWSEATSGPKPFNGSGYNALTFVPKLAGDYNFEFNAGSATTLNMRQRIFTYFDATVVDTVNANTIKLGRLWSKAWDINCNSGSNTFDTKVFVYSRDSVVTTIDFNGMQPYGFIISCNSSGCTNTGDVASDRKSRVGNVTYPEYKLFLNDPDPACYPNKTECGDITQDPVITGCDANNRCIEVMVSKPGQVEILLDFEAPDGYNGENSRDIILSSTVVTGRNCIKWDTRDGRGNLVPKQSVFKINVNYFNGLTHLPLYDVENHLNGYKVSLVRPKGGTCGESPFLRWDDSDIVGGNALDQKVQFNAGITQGHRWSGRGDNGCAGGVAARCPETINTWWYGGTVTRTVSYRDSAILVDANKNTPGFGSPANDTTVCSNIGEVPLHGLVSGFTQTGVWSVVKGAGSIKFNPATLENFYVPASADRVVGNIITLKLTATNTGVCDQVHDTLRIFFREGPTIKIDNTPSIDICTNNPVANLTATKNAVVGTFVWIGGTGEFVPNRNTMNITYKPTQQELNAAQDIKLILRSTTQQGCTPASDSVTVKFKSPPTVQVANALNVCKNNPRRISLGGFSSTGSGVWSGGVASHFSSLTDINATYDISAQEAALGQDIVLTLTSANNGRCNAVSATTTIKFFAAPSITAGTDLIVCSNKADVQLTATSSTNKGRWKPLGVTGIFTPNDSTLNAVFRPAQAVINAQQPFKLEFSAGGSSSGCASIADTVQVTFKSSPAVNAGQNKILCENSTVVDLKGATSSTGTGRWLGGSGIFSDRNDLAARYTPTALEIANGEMALFLETTNNDICNPARDTIIINFTPAPIVALSSDKTICKNNNIVSMAGTMADLYESVQWSASVPGIFKPNNASDDFDNVTFTPTGTQGPFTITLKAFNNSLGCAPVEDNLTVNYINQPIVNAGSDLSVCKNNINISLSGTSSTGSGRWSGGAGSFGNVNSLKTQYTPSAAEITAGSVELTLTSVQNGACNPVSDKVMITFTEPPTVDAGSDKSVCANKPNAILQGTSSTNKGSWSGGKGAFSPKIDTNTVTYIPAASETSVAPTSVKLYYTSNAVNNCLPVKDSVMVMITSSPVADAGTDIVQCKNNINIKLNATLAGAGGGIWSNGSGTYSPNSGNSKAAYTPSANEITKGFVILKWTTVGNGACNKVSDSVRITFTEPPVANAGSDVTVCENATTVALKGTVANATDGTWTTLAGAPVATTANANYTFTAADKTKGYATFVLQTTGVGNCLPVTDTMNVFITKIAKVNAGEDQEICISDVPVDLVAVGNTGKWVIKSGAGTFSNANSLQTKFTPAPSTVNTTVLLSYVNDPSGSCNSMSDDVAIKVLPGPIVSTVADLDVCGNTKTINISGTVSGSTTSGVWISADAQGSIANINAMSTTYTMTDKESKNNTNLVFILQSTNNGICKARRDTLKVKITPAPQISAGPDLLTCEGSIIDVASTVDKGTFASWTSLTGGSFNPASSLVSKYTPSASENTSGKATLIAATNANGPCPAVRDTVVITLKKGPTVGVPANFNICGDTNKLSITATSSTNAGIWKTNGLGIITPDISNPLKYNYELDPSEGVNGATITFTFVSSNNDVCPPVQKNTVVTVLPRPIVGIIDRDTVCNDGSVLNLSIQTTHINGVVWSTTGDGIFANPTAFATTYTLGVNDRKSTQFVIINTAKGDGSCKPVVVNKSVLVVPRPEVFAGADREICEDFKGNLALLGTSKNAVSTAWFNVTATGTYADETKLSTNYTVAATDAVNPTFQIGLLANGNPKCKVVRDTLLVNVKKKPTSGPDSTLTICESTTSVHFLGVSSTGSGIWKSTGTGLFSPKADTLSVRYLITDADRAKGGFIATFSTTNNQSCSAAQSMRTVTITKPPVIFVEPAAEMCETATDVTINAAVSNAGGIAWKTSGTGVFDDINSQTPKYTPSALDKAAGKVVLTAVTTQNGNCTPTSAQVVLTITPSPNINGPSTISVCNEKDSVRIELSVKNSSGVTWTGGLGTFREKSNDTTAYYPSRAELDAAPSSVVLTATTMPFGSCGSQNKNVTIEIVPKPTVQVTDPVKMCGDQNSVSLSATFANANGILWNKVGLGGVVANSTSTTNATYQPTGTEKKVGGNVRIRIETTGNGVCQPARDTLTIVITPKPAISDMGPDIEICDDNTDGVGLGLPTIIGAEKALWTASGNGIILDNGTILSSYVPTANDLEAGSVTFKITTNPENTTCKSISASKKLIVRKKPTVDAGPDRTVCITASSIGINGFITNATGGYWSTSGDGTFNNHQSLNTSYVFGTKTTTDIVLTAVGSGVCPVVNDTMKLDFISEPKVDAGRDTTFCTSNLPIKLRASGADGTWSLDNAPTTGTFSPSNQALNAEFTPTTPTTGVYEFSIISNTFGGACKADTDEVVITVIDGPSVALPANVTICEDQNSINLTATSSNLGSSTTKWVAIGSGTFTAQNSNTTTYNLSANDLDVGKIVIQFSTEGGVCPAEADTMTVNIQKKPFVIAGDNHEMCISASNVQLSSEVIGATQVAWTNITTNGTGFDNASTLNPLYTISNNDKTAGVVQLRVQTQDNGQCGASADTLELRFEQLKSLEIGKDTALCFNENFFALKPTTNNIKSVSWSTNGKGEFDPNNTAIAVNYGIAQEDKTAGTVKFVIATNDQSLCPDLRDSLILTIKPEPKLSFVENFMQVCAEVSDVDLTATASNVANVKWEASGNGTFSDDDALTTKYQLSAQDKDKGGVSFVVRSVNTDNCPNVSAGVAIQLVPKQVAVVNAGFDQFQCRDNNNVNLSGIVKAKGGGRWTVIGNANPIFTPNDTTLATVYQPTAFEINNGVRLVLSTRQADLCGIYRDTVRISFTPTPVVDIVSPSSAITICADSQRVDLTSSFTVAKSGVWTSTGKGIFVKNEFQTNLSYFPHPDDIKGGRIVLTYTSLDNGTCIGNYFDTMAVNYTPIPVILGSEEGLACKNNPVYKLNFTINSPYPGRIDTWKTSSGLGSFDPSANDLGAVFTADPKDVAKGVVVLTLETTNNGTCKAQSKNLKLNFTAAPVVRAGIDKVLCENNALVQLNGSISGGASKGLWLTSGSGTFVESASSLKAVYIPSESDLAAKQIMIKLMSTDNSNGTCIPELDSFKVDFTPRPVLNASSKFLCAFDKGIEFTGTITGGNFTAQWSSSGTGLFAPSKFANLVEYTPSSDDKVVQNVFIKYRTQDVGNCAADSVVIPIFVTPLPIADAGPDRFVCNGFKDTVEIAINDEYRYDWQEIGEVYKVDDNPVLVTPEIVKPFHSYQLQVTDPRGCVSFDTLKVTPINSPGMSILPKICLKPNLTIAPKATNADPRADYQWYRNGVPMAMGTDSTLKVSQAGLYTVQYTLGSCNIYKASTRVLQNPVVFTRDALYCKDDTASVTVERIFKGFNTYSWVMNGLPLVEKDTTIKKVVTLDTNKFVVTARNFDGCTTKDSAYVLTIPRPLMNLQPNQPGCIGSTLVLDATPSKEYPNGVRTWTFNGTPLKDTTATLSLTQTTYGDGTYAVTYKVEECVSRDTSVVKFFALPATSTLSKQFCSLTAGKLPITIDFDTTAYGIKWLTPLNKVLNASDTVRRILVDSTDFLKLTEKHFIYELQNEAGCKMKDSVVVKDLCDITIHVPTGFTPNKDGNNDTFGVFGLEKYIKTYELYVFNRWGEVIFRSEDFYETWDGTYREEDMPVGVYPYVITYELKDPAFAGKRKQNGKITIVR